MDNVKTGAFIRQMRKERGLTQLQLAEQLNITDRAVSKWERGLCAPDIAMLEPLAEILNVSILELIEGQCASPSQRIPEIEETVIAVIDYSEQEMTRRAKTSNQKWIALSCTIVIVLAGIIGIILWKSGLPFIIDRSVSPDGLYSITVYSKQLDGSGFGFDDATSLIVEKNDEDLSIRFDYGNYQYQGVWWSPDSQKYVLSLRGNEGTRLVLDSMITSTSSNLNAMLGMGVYTTELHKYGHRTEGESFNVDYEFLQWALDSQSMLIYYKFKDQSDTMHDGYFWYNSETGEVSAILEMNIKESEGN